MKQKEDSKTLLVGESDPGTSSFHGPVRRVLDGATVSPPPVWLMRQAGRYLPEYRKLRARAGSFLDLCFDVELATEVTLQPVKRFDLDAAILFSDILVVPLALGRKVWFIEGEGPRLEPIDGSGIAALDDGDAALGLKAVLEIVSGVRKRLGSDKTLIGFCGAPWTVATYMVAGRGTPDQAPARVLAAREPELFERLIDRLVTASADYLIAQIEAGADVVQLFDTWAGILGETEFERWCIRPTAEIVRRVKAARPAARIVGFPKGAGLRLARYVEATGVDGLSVDWTVPLDYARQRLQPLVAVQGNLDPMVLLTGGRALDEAVGRILAALAGGRFIFNLGHGVVPETPVAHVERLVERVRSG